MELKNPEQERGVWVRISCIVDSCLRASHQRAGQFGFCRAVSSTMAKGHITAWRVDSRKLVVPHELLQGPRCSRHGINRGTDLDARTWFT